MSFSVAREGGGRNELIYRTAIYQLLLNKKMSVNFYGECVNEFTTYVQLIDNNHWEMEVRRYH